MLGNTLISVGGLFFCILLTIVYSMKAKQTNINNKLFKLTLVFLNLTIVSELVAIACIYFGNSLISNIASRANSFFTVSWVLSLSCYIINIGSGHKIPDLKEYMIKNTKARILLILYIFVIIISLFLEFNNISNSKGVYLSGDALYFLYIVALIAVISSIIVVVRNNKEITDIKPTPIIIGIIVSITVMGLQLVFPMYLMLTGMFVFDTYILYFMFENPDLYLIKELEQAKKKADDSNRAKTDFLSNMSHEIRTPMNAILGFSNGILTEEKFSSQQIKKDITHIYSAGNNLLEIINNILDISKIETGEEKIENTEYSLGNIVLELKSIIDARLGDKKIRFITDVDSNTPSKLIGDKTKIFQILLNLLSNAVKYTEVGRIKLKIKSNIIDNRVVLNMEVSDTGYGIKKEDYEKLFEKFSRLEIASQKEIEGTGLGLVITKRLLTLLGGKIWFESEYGAGTVFYIELSQKIADKNPIGNIESEIQVETNSDYLNCSEYKLMLVDDNKLNLKVAEKVLSNYKFQITSFDNGEDCINSIKEGDIYDIIFLDHMMPKMDGIEVLHILKKLKGYKIPPIVVLTANAITGMKEMYLSEGFDDYLSKPINTGDLAKIINKYFDKEGDEKDE